MYEKQLALEQVIETLRMLLQAEASLPITLLRSEARLLAIIKGEPGHPVKYYMNKSDMSYRGFFNSLGLLTTTGLVREQVSEVDRRQKLLS